jgi:hypothetical protein
MKIKREEKSESQVVRDICRYLDATWMRGRYSVTDVSGSHFFKHGHLGRRGWPDICGCIPGSGRFLAIEVKGLHGHVSDAQKDTLGRLDRAGGLVILARCVDDVARKLDPVLALYRGV